MTIGKKQENGKIIFSLDGRLDTVTSPQLQSALIPVFDETAYVELDFTKLAYISSAGLRVLLIGQKTAKANNALMTVSNVSEEIMEVFTMTGFSDVLIINC